jgi:hypothetical protein
MSRRPVLWFFRIAFAALALGVAAASVSNVLLDNAEVRALAEATACGSLVSPACAGQGPTRIERTPFGQTFDFVTKTHATITVRCTRSLILVGAYSCARE